MRTKVLSTMAVFAIVAGAAGAAFAGDGLTAGTYEVTVPGIGTVVLEVTDGVVEVTTVPDGYSWELDADDDESEFLILDGAGDTALKIEFDGDELEIKGATATPGTHIFTLPNIGTVTVEVAADGTIVSVVAPGFTVELDDQGQVTLGSEDGTIEMKIEIENGVIEFQVEVEDESEIDDESDDDDSDNVLSDDSDDDSDDDDSDDEHDEEDDEDDEDKDHDSDDDDESHDDSHDD
jgi:hypothetical protein